MKVSSEAEQGKGQVPTPGSASPQEASSARSTGPERTVGPETAKLKFGLLAGFVAAAGTVAGVSTLFGFLGRLWWFFDLFSHFRVQYFWGLVAVAALLLLLKRRKLAAGFGAAAVINLAVVLPLYFGGAGGAAAPGGTLRAMLINVNTERGDPRRVARVLEEYDPDIIVLKEVNARWIADLAGATKSYPHSLSEPRGDNFGIALYSKLPFTRSEIAYIGDAQVPSVIVEIQTGGAKFTVVGTHPLPPAGRRRSRWRNDQLAEVADHIAGMNTPVLLLGDLNTTPWNHHFKRLLRRAGLVNGSQGRGVQGTWPTHSLLLRIPIDHCLHSPEIRVVGKIIGPDVGSDHFPVIVDFVVAAGKK